MSIYDYKIQTRKNGEISMEEFRGKVLLIVNTATGCGFTPQYKGIEELYKKYHEKGLEVLDFPCDQFGHQAPGSDEEIHNFCTLKYKTSFDQFAKTEVNGENQSPLFAYLKEQKGFEGFKGITAKILMPIVKKNDKDYKTSKNIKWNFTKFLVNRDGEVVARFEPWVAPEKMEKEIQKLI